MTERSPQPQPGGPRSRSGSFVDNRRLPVHRWFRYSAGFSGDWAESLLAEQHGDAAVLDPFAGVATTLLAAAASGRTAIGVEAHPFVARIGRAKLLRPESASFARFAHAVLDDARGSDPPPDPDWPELVVRCFEPDALDRLGRLRAALHRVADDSPEAELTWLLLTCLLRPVSHVGTAQWQYVLPTRRKAAAKEPFELFESVAQTFAQDLDLARERESGAHAVLHLGDARTLSAVPTDSVDFVLTSPPYANNYDYADSTRLEMSFWGLVRSWSDLHEAVRRHLLTSCSQHAQKERVDLELLLSSPFARPIGAELEEVTRELDQVRRERKGQKHYHTMVAAYFVDMARTLTALRRVCRPASAACLVVGDSAPYGVYVPVDRWLGELAVAAGFADWRFEKLRDRNTRWKNRKHRVPLKEGRLWLRG